VPARQSPQRWNSARACAIPAADASGDTQRMIKPIVTIVLAAALALPAAAQNSASPPIVGGYAQVADPAQDAEIAQAARIAVNLMDKPALVAKIESASRQVVAGMNFRLRLALTDGTRWDVVVYRSLDGAWRLADQAGLASTKSAKPLPWSGAAPVKPCRKSPGSRHCTRD